MPRWCSRPPATPRTSTTTPTRAKCVPMAPSADQAKHDHQKSVKNCARCRWEKSGTAWQTEVAFRDPASGTIVSPIIVRPQYMPGPWAIGCVVCANFVASTAFPGKVAGARSNVFARFSVSALSCVQKSEILRHCKSGMHMEALKALASSVPFGSQPGAGSPQQPVLEGVCSASSAVGACVPRAERFVWAIQNVHRGGSMRDYAEWCKVNDLSSFLTSEGVCRDSSPQMASKIIASVGAVLREDHRALLRKAERPTFSVDERDQVFLMRVRVAFTKPEVGAAEFVAGLLRDYGTSTEASVDATWRCFRDLCTVHGQRRNSGSQPDGAPSVDEALLEHVKKITIAGASDGCAAAMKAIQLLRERHLPNLRFQFRDRPHTTRTCMKGILKYMAEGTPLLEALVSGKESFATKSQVQPAVPADLDEETSGGIGGCATIQSSA